MYTFGILYVSYHTRNTAFMATAVQNDHWPSDKKYICTASSHIRLDVCGFVCVCPSILITRQLSEGFILGVWCFGIKLFAMNLALVPLAVHNNNEAT